MHDGALQGWYAFPCLHSRAEGLSGLFFRVGQDWPPPADVRCIGSALGTGWALRW